MGAEAAIPARTALAGKRAVLLLAHGTPETVEEIPEYLKNVVSGRALPQAVIEEIQHRYAQIGKSPLTEWTMRQAELLQAELQLPVYVGMRNWKPYIAETVRKMRADGVTEAVAICLAPQNSRTSVGLYRRAALTEAGDAMRLEFIDAWADHPRLIAAFAERLRETWRTVCREMGAKIPVIFTAHSVPCRTVQLAIASAAGSSATEPASAEISDRKKERAATEKAIEPVRPTLPERSYAAPASALQGPDPYAVEAKRTAMRVAEMMASDGLRERDWVFAFQSQGASGGPWIGPTVEETLQALRKEGHAGVVLQPIGFLCDHVEILYDIDIAFQAQARTLGMKLWRPRSLNDSPLLMEALADLARTGIARLQGANSLPTSASLTSA